MKKPVGIYPLALMMMLFFGNPIHAAIVISELDCDTDGTDTAEFVEIMNTGSEEFDFSQNPFILVFFNGYNDEDYRVVDITGILTPGEVLVVGGPDVQPTPDIAMGSSFIQNGADAVALYPGTTLKWANEEIGVGDFADALVYDTDDPDDAGLLEIFDALERIQVNENMNGNSEFESIQRIEMGIGGSHFKVGPATPGESALVPVPGALYLLGSGLILLVGVRARSNEGCMVRPQGGYRYH